METYEVIGYRKVIVFVFLFALFLINMLSKSAFTIHAFYLQTLKGVYLCFAEIGNFLGNILNISNECLL